MDSSHWLGQSREQVKESRVHTSSEDKSKAPAILGSHFLFVEGH